VFVGVLDAAGKHQHARREWSRDGSFTLSCLPKGRYTLRVIRSTKGAAQVQIAEARNVSTGTKDLEMRTNR